MIDTTARASVKIRLGIPSATTTFDSIIDEFVLSGVKRLYPIAQREVAIQNVSVSVDSFGEASVELSTMTSPALSSRKVEASSGGLFWPVEDTYHHGTQLIARGLSSDVTSLKIYGLTSYELADVASHLEQAVLWFAMSEFYDYLAGDKASYNIYMQSGARNVDNMQDESDKYEQKANVYLNDRVMLYGVQ